MKKIKASIIGVTGYTGLELLRLLLAHPQAELAHLTSRQHKSEPIGAVFPHLAHLDLKITDAAPGDTARDSDVVFLCLPHGMAQEAVAALHGKVRLVDLSADYRLDDPAAYGKYYGEHKYPELLKEIVYGLPEITGNEAIRNASSVANPGCFALLCQLLLFPFKGRIEQADIMAVTGSSGAGKTPGEGTHHPLRSHNMKSYNINLHRHIPEIAATTGLREELLNFVPTSGPFARGIFATAFIELDPSSSPPSSSSRRKPGSTDQKSQDPVLQRDDAAILNLAEKAYKNCPFIRLTDSVALANITGSNFADLSFQAGRNGHIIAQGALDNLVKGAAGTAVQNMNIMFGLNEGTGLLNLGPLYP